MHTLFQRESREEWTSSELMLDDERYEIFKKRIYDFFDAQALVERSYKEVYLNKGVLFLGEGGPPLKAISIEELAEIASRNEEVPQEKRFTEVIYIPHLQWPVTLALLDRFKFLEDGERSEREALVLRKKTKTLLREISEICDFAVTSLNRVCLDCEFLKPVPRPRLNEISNRVLDFDEAHFGMEVKREHWMETFANWNCFSIGPK